MLTGVLAFSGDCNNKECTFLHVKPAPRSRDCPWYDQGFCRDGEALMDRELGWAGLGSPQGRAQLPRDGTAEMPAEGPTAAAPSLCSGRDPL